jgi:hypothetical protein
MLSAPSQATAGNCILQCQSTLSRASTSCPKKLKSNP